MAIVRIDFTQGQPDGFASTVSEVVHSAMQEILGIPPQENFIICQSRERGAILHAPETCSPARLEKLVFVQVTLNQGRSTELKATFYMQLSQRLATTGLVEANNVFINLVEVARDNWFFDASGGTGPE